MTFETMAWVLSIFTLANMWLAGSKNRWTWHVGLAGQALWFVFIIGTEQWGLMLGAVGITFVMIRNWMLWRGTD